MKLKLGIGGLTGSKGDAGELGRVVPESTPEREEVA